MRVLVTRPAPGSDRTAARLRALGHEPVALPVAVIRPTGAPWPSLRPDAIALTSAHGLAGLDGPTAVALAAVPLYAVGTRTAAAARASGFRDVREAGGDAVALGRVLVRDVRERGRVLYPAGVVRKPALEKALAAAGFAVSLVETYESVPVEPMELGRALDDLQAGGLRIDAVLHYSRAGAAAFVAAARASRHEAALLALPHGCLSADVAEPLREAGAARIAVAARPDEEALLNCLSLHA